MIAKVGANKSEEGHMRYPERKDFALFGYSVIRIAACLVAFGCLSGCGLIGDPSFNLFGAFFPAWLLCAVLGIFCAILARVLFVASGLADTLPLQLFLCTAIGLLFGSLTWLLFFG